MNKRSIRGYTLVELAVTAGVVVIAGALLFSVARTISYLGAKNAAINLTHSQARSAIHRAISEIRDSVSIPQLTDATGASLGTSAGPAAGVSYQQIVAGPGKVWSTAAAGQKTIVITTHAGDPAVSTGMRLIVPAWAIESDITNVATSGANMTITLAQNIPSTITCTSGVPNYIAYFTQRSSLVVVGSDLRYYRVKGTSTFDVVASNVTTPLPFSVPNNDNRFIQTAFTVQDPRILGRSFKDMNLKMSLAIPYRYRLTTYQ